MNNQNKQFAAESFLALFDDKEAAISYIKRLPDKSNKPKASKNTNPIIVKIEAVSKEYKLGKQTVKAVKNVSLSIRQGEFVALTGPSGSGKSTLLQLIGGLDTPSSGMVEVAGHNIAKLRDGKLSVFRNQTIGFVFQFFYLQPFLTLKTNLEVPGMFAHTKRSQRLAKINQLAEQVGLSDRINHYPKELSGGQMQRAAIARALLNNPKVILADEPTGNLDSENGQAIIDLFQQIRKDFGTTIVIVTHDKTIAVQADREMALKDGEIIA